MNKFRHYLVQIGDKLYAGTVNFDGRVIFQVTGIGHETILSQIAELVAKEFN